MKKIISLAIAILMIALGTVAAFPATAAAAVDGVEPVVHYDFSGDTIDEALKDKAKGGSVADDLKAYVGQSCTYNAPVEYMLEDTLAHTGFSDFNANVSWDKSNGSIQTGANTTLQAPSSSDIKSVLSEDGSTLVIRFKLATFTGNHTLASVAVDNANMKCSILFDVGVQDAATGKAFFRAITTKADGSRNYTKLCYPMMNKSDWYTIVVNMTETMTGTNANEDKTGSITFSGWMMGPTTGTINTTVGTYAHYSAIHNNAPLSLFDVPYNSSKTAVATLDDFRIYNTTLTEAQAKALDFSPVASDDPTLPVKDMFMQTAVKGDYHDIRLSAVIDELTFDCQSVGFEVQASYVNNGSTVVSYVKTYTTNTLYESILASADGSIQTVSAAERGGKYIMCIAFSDVPNSCGDVTFVVKPFALNGSERIYLDTYTFVENSGKGVQS